MKSYEMSIKPMVIAVTIMLSAILGGCMKIKEIGSPMKKDTAGMNEAYMEKLRTEIKENKLNKEGIECRATEIKKAAEVLRDAETAYEYSIKQFRNVQKNKEDFQGAEDFSEKEMMVEILNIDKKYSEETLKKTEIEFEESICLELSALR